MAYNLDKFINDQLSIWHEVAVRFRNLKEVSLKRMNISGLDVILQHNPDRIASSTALTDEESIKKRKCFLCAENIPSEQMSKVFDGRKGRKYHIRVNPFPIFPHHLVISRVKHQPQSIWHHFVDMLDMAAAFQGNTVFYNGPKCGASAPDHLHFQACPCGLMPLEIAVNHAFDSLMATGSEPSLRYVSSVQDADLYHYTGYTRGVFALRARTSKSMAKLFYRLLECAPLQEEDKEPKINLFTYCHGNEFRAIVVFRAKHWSHHFFCEGEEHFSMGLGCADMAGIFIVPVKEDFEKISASVVEEMLEEVTLSEAEQNRVIHRLTRTQRKLSVGIMSADVIAFEIISDGAGPQKVSYREGKIDYNGVLYDELYFDAVTMSTMFAEPSFILKGVTIGIGFHWERKVDQTFAGALKFIVNGDKITAVNIIGVEDYLLSVISSEMKASATLEFLKAHAVISRSWVISQIERKGKVTPCPVCASEPGTDEFIKWWDHEDHTLFDVCADDHCQRYQGLTMAVGENVRKAIDQTWGQVLMYDGHICDARFSKCCGGMTERFSACWGDEDYPYLAVFPDTPGEKPESEDNVCFCNTDDEKILSQVLNDYDLESKDFYRWEVKYTTGEISELAGRRSGIMFGEIRDLIPVERGGSGRISRLKVVGSNRTVTIGKELMIRRTFSESHLKSSAFDVEKTPEGFILRGKGWGHGVGLCQIGAAVMSYKGYNHEQILTHYYPGAEIKTEN